MGKKSTGSKQNTMTSATQTTMKSQDEIVAELTERKLQNDFKVK